MSLNNNNGNGYFRNFDYSGKIGTIQKKPDSNV